MNYRDLEIVLGVAVLVTVAACAQRPRESSAITPSVRLVFLTRGGCVASETMRAHLDDALRAMRPAPAYQVVDQDTLEASDLRRGYPTPTLLFDNRDVFSMAEPKPPLPEPT